MATPVAEQPHMPGYGVGTDDWSPLPWSWAADRLAGTRNFWVATATRGGRPHAMPVWGVWDDVDAQFCFSCAPSARKARNIGENPRVVIATSDTVECVSIEATAVRLSDARRIDRWIDRYLAKYRLVAPGLDADFLLANVLVECVPRRAFGIIEREGEFAARATRWVFA